MLWDRETEQHGIAGDQQKPQASDEQNIRGTVEGIGFGIKYAVLDKGPDDNLMIWQSRQSSNPGGKLRATEKAGAKRNGRKGCRPERGGGGNWDKNTVLRLHRGKYREVVLVSERRPLR